MSFSSSLRIFYLHSDVSLSNAQTAVPQTPAILLGTAWYPEQWPESRWDADLALMQKAGIHMVRVGEFAWSRMEPTEGHYDLDWLDRAVAAAAKHRIVTVIGTPTAAPPAWLTQKYPETLRTMADGRKDQHGNRQQFNFANPKYRELARAMAEQWPSVSATTPTWWDGRSTTSTLNVSFDPETRQQFQQWLKATLRHARQSQRPLDDFVLERDLLRLEPGADPGQLRQSRVAAELDALRQRYLAQLSEESARSDPRQTLIRGSSSPPT